MDLYQENVPNLINSTNFYTSKKQSLFEYVNMNKKRLTDLVLDQYIIARNCDNNISIITVMLGRDDGIGNDLMCTGSIRMNLENYTFAMATFS